MSPHDIAYTKLADLPLLFNSKKGLIMKSSFIASHCMLIAALIITSTALAAETRLPTSAKTETKGDNEIRGNSPLGYVAGASAAAKEITIVAGRTRHIRVERLETYRIVDGSSTLLWTFDTFGLPSFPLSKILPGSSNVVVHVDESPMYAN